MSIRLIVLIAILCTLLWAIQEWVIKDSVKRSKQVLLPLEEQSDPANVAVSEEGGSERSEQVNLPLQAQSGPVTPIQMDRGDVSDTIISLHQEVHRTFATKYDLWVGPLRYSYSTTGNNISISGDPEVMYFHTPDQSLIMARSASLHEYVHLVQMAYGAPSKYVKGGDTEENWRFMGPRWWSEGSAVWITLVYSQLNGIDIGEAYDTIFIKCSEYKAATYNCKINGRRVTIKEIVTPNETDNPEWRKVDECGIYGSHVYHGGLCAIDFVMKSRRTEEGVRSIIGMIKSVSTKDDWLRAFLDWSGYNSLSDFHAEFDAVLLSNF